MIPYGLILRIGLPLILLAAFGAWCWTGGKASERKVWKAKESAQIEAQLAASEQARAKETALQIKVEQANEARKLDNQKNARVAAKLRGDNERLRGEFTAFIRGTPGESSDACVERGEAAGVVLLQAVSVAGEFAEAGEACEADKRALISAWPK